MTIFYTAAWIFIGPLILVYFILSDVGRMFKLMTYHNGCKEAHNLTNDLEAKVHDQDDLMRCFNEARDVVINQYIKLMKENGNQYFAEGEEADIEKFDVLETLKRDEEMIEEYRQSFVVRASTLTDTWLKDEKEKKRKEEEGLKNAALQKKQEKDSAKIEEQKRLEQEKKQLGNKSKSGKLKNTHIESKGGRSEKIAELYIDQVVQNEQNDDEEEEQEE